MPFVTPIFAALAVAMIAIPIAIHLLNRRRYKIVEWAAMKFLLDAIKQNRRRMKFESWLLLALRCAAIFLCGLALARPMGCDSASLAALAGSRTGLHVIVLDDSYSMGYTGGGPTHFERAKQIAKQLIDGLNPGGESVAIITGGTPAKVVLRPTYDLDAARGVLDRAVISSSSTDLLGAFRLSEDLKGDAEQSAARSLYLLSDASTSSLRGDFATPLAEAAKGVALRYRVTYFNLGIAGQSNAAVWSVRSAEPLVRAGFANELLASVAGYATTPGNSVIWSQGDRLIGAAMPVNLSPQSTSVQQSEASLDTPGPQVINAQLSTHDRLPIDDTARSVVDVAAALKVLIVEGRRGSEALDRSGAFLQRALAPPAADSSDPLTRATNYIAPDVISDLELAGRPLSEFRAIFMTDVGGISPETAKSLQAFAERGGAILWFMGESVTADNYNQVLVPLGLLPGPLVSRVEQPDNAPIHLDFNPANPHPILTAFRNVDRSGLDTARFEKYWKIDISGKPGVQSVIRFQPAANAAPGSEGDVAITSSDLGAGKIIFVATSADDAWTGFPAKPAYVALVHELLAHAAGGGENWMNREVGQPIVLPLGVALGGTPTLLDPKNRSQSLKSSMVGDQTRWQSEPLTEPGLYTLDTGAAKFPIAVNVPGGEADIRVMDEGAIRKSLGDIDLTFRQQTAGESASGAQPNFDYGWALLMALFLILCGEAIAARLFTHARREQVAAT